VCISALVLTHSSLLLNSPHFQIPIVNGVSSQNAAIGAVARKAE
jgi:hypothetical protein